MEVEYESVFCKRCGVKFFEGLWKGTIVLKCPHCKHRNHIVSTGLHAEIVQVDKVPPRSVLVAS